MGIIFFVINCAYTVQMMYITQSTDNKKRVVKIKKFLLLGSLLDLVTTPHVEKSPCNWVLGPPRGVQRGVTGVKNKNG